MPPNISNTNLKVYTEKDLQKEGSSTEKKINDESVTQGERQIVTKTDGWEIRNVKWINLILITSLHLYFIYACFTFDFLKNLKTTAWFLFLYISGGFGVTGGVHRLWTHRAYKAKWPLRVILAVAYSSAGMNDIYQWVRDHRVHHKFVDTDADPHNSKRGFFFSHVGWLFLKKHPEVIRRGRQVDMSDILSDPIAALSVKYFPIFRFVFAYLLPVVIPVYGWNETWYRAILSQVIRYVIILNSTWSVNSVAHIWGAKPYDVHIDPTENRWVSLVTGGEGWHNYHHVFPWDYKAAELRYSVTTEIINFFGLIGWAYDMKQPSLEIVKSVVLKKGDGSHSMWNAVPCPADKIE